MTDISIARRLMPCALIAVLATGCGDAESDPGSAADSASAPTAAPTQSGPVASDEASATESVTGEAGGSVTGEAGGSKAAEPTDNAERQTDEPAETSGEQEEYDYPDEPEPAAGVVATLCNLDPGYLGSLRNENSSGEPIVDDDLRLSALALGDQISYWETLRDDYPEAASDIDRAGKVRELWKQAILSQDNGDASSAKRAMAEADDVIDSLSGGAAPNSADCVG